MESDGALGFVAQANEKVCQNTAAVTASASGRQPLQRGGFPLGVGRRVRRDGHATLRKISPYSFQFLIRSPSHRRVRDERSSACTPLHVCAHRRGFPMWWRRQPRPARFASGPNPPVFKPQFVSSEGNHEGKLGLSPSACHKVTQGYKVRQAYVCARTCVFSEACLLQGINTFHAAGRLRLRVNSPFTGLTDVIIPQKDSGSRREGLCNVVLVSWDG